MGEPASHAIRINHEVVRQLCRPQINGLAGRPSYGLLKEVDGPEPLLVITPRNRCPAVRSGLIRHGAEMYAVTGRDAEITGQSRSAKPTTTWLEAQSVLLKRKLKIKPLDAWNIGICNHNVTGKVATPTHRKRIKRVPGYVPHHGDTAARKAATCALDRTSLRRSIDDRVLQQRFRPIDPDLLLHLGHDCEVRIYQWPQAQIGYPAGEVPFIPFLEPSSTWKPFSGRIGRVMSAHKDPSGYASMPTQPTSGQDTSCTMLVPFP